MIPDRSLLWLLLGPTVAALLVPALPAALPWVLAADALLLGVLLLDALTLPSAGSLQLARHAGRTLSVGRQNAVRLELHNRGRRALLVSVEESYPAALEVTGLPARARVPARTRHTFAYTLLPHRRGDFQPGRTYLTAWSLLGLWRRRLRPQLPGALRVFPDVKALSTYALLARRNRIDLLGFRLARARGAAVEFDRLREYQPDDDFRRIDPLASSRHRRLISREYQVSRNQNVFFVIDCGRLMAAESGGLSNLDHALNATVMLSTMALELGDNVGLLAFDDEVRALMPMSRGLRSRSAVLNAVYHLQVGAAEPDYELAFLTLARRVRQRSLVVLLTNVMDAGTFDLLRPHLCLLQRRHLPLVVLLRDADLFQLADDPPADLAGFYHRGAAAELAAWRERTAADLQRQGALVLDLPPAAVTPELINGYLRIKAEQLL